MNILKNKELLNTPIYDLLSLENTNENYFLEIKKGLGYGMALVSNRMGLLYKNVSDNPLFERKEKIDLNILFKNISVSSKGLESIFDFYKKIRNATMHYFSPVYYNDFCLENEVIILMINRLKRKKVKDLMVIKKDKLTLFGAVVAITFALDFNSERTSFFRVLANGHRQTATDMSFDCFGEMPCQNSDAKTEKPKIRKFFEQYYISSLINFSLSVERYFVNVLDDNSENDFTSISFIKTLNEMNVIGREQLNFIRNIGAHGLNIKDFYNHNEVTFSSIMMNFKIIKEQYEDDSVIKKLIKEVCGAFLTYKYSVVYIKQLSYLNNGKFTIDNHHDEGFMSEYRSLESKNIFLTDEGESIIYDMFGNDIQLSHPSNRYRNELKKINGSEKFNIFKFKFYLITRNAQSQYIFDQLDIDIDEIFIEKTVFTTKNIEVPSIIKTDYKSPFCEIYRTY